jgi:hypothetical protein
MNRATRANQPVELFERLATDTHLLLVADQPHLVSAGASLDAELLLENAESTLAVPVERSGHLVVIEDQGLASAGIVSGQW